MNFFWYPCVKPFISPVTVLRILDYILPACIEDNIQAKPGINCVPQGEITDALNLLKAVLPELTKRGINYYCGSNVVPFMTDEHVMDHLARNYAPRVMSVETFVISYFNNFFFLGSVRGPEGYK